MKTLLSLEPDWVVLHSQSLHGPQAPILSNVLGSTGFEGVEARG